MKKRERDALIHELDKLVGNINPDGSRHTDPETICDSDGDPIQACRPSREKIKEIAQRLADRRFNRLHPTPKPR